MHLPNLPRLFVLLALPPMIFLTLLLPLGEAPDEGTHIARAASVLRGQLIGYRTELVHPADGAPITMAGMNINSGFLAPMLFLPSLPEAPRKPLTLEMWQQSWVSHWAANVSFVEASNTASYMPLFYVPSAMGLGVARLAGAGPMPTLLTGRIFNAIFCILVGYLSLRLADRGRPALFALLVLPMTIHLSASITQDGPLLALAALAAALFPRKARGAYWSAAAALACVVAAKPAYLPLAIAALVPLDGGVWRLHRHGLGFLVVIVIGLAWTGLAAVVAVVPFWRPPYHPGPLWPGDPTTLFRATNPAAQLQVLLHRPMELIQLPLRTMEINWRFLASSAVGVLGSLDLRLPEWTYRLWYLALATAGTAAIVSVRSVTECDAKAPQTGPRLWASGSVLVGALACLYGVILLQYLSWTNVGHETVDGVQGRYLLPILILLIPALPALTIPLRFATALRRTLAAPAVCAGLIGLGLLPLAIVTRYYIH